MNAATTDIVASDYNIRDISQAQVGRRRIEMADRDMPA